MSVDTNIEQAEQSIEEGQKRAQQVRACLDDALTNFANLAEQGFEPEQLKAAQDCLRVARDNQSAAAMRLDLAQSYIDLFHRLAATGEHQ
jgi:hypothetical protein